MTISAPHDGKLPLPQSVAAVLDETMEEVATPLGGVGPSEEPRKVAQESATFRKVSAPVHAPCNGEPSSRVLAVPPYLPSPDAQPVRVGGSEARDRQLVAAALSVLVPLLALAFAGRGEVWR